LKIVGNRAPAASMFMRVRLATASASTTT